jgi:hypothetical protein
MFRKFAPAAVLNTVAAVGRRAKLVQLEVCSAIIRWIISCQTGAAWNPNGAGERLRNKVTAYTMLSTNKHVRSKII